MLSGWEGEADGDNLIQGSITGFKQTEKIQVWSQQVSAEGQSCGNEEGCHCPGAMQGEKDLPTSLLPGRWGVHPGPRTWGHSRRAQEATEPPNVLFFSTRKTCRPGSIPPEQARSYGQPPHGVSEAGAGWQAALNPPNSLHKSRIQHA